MSSSWLKGSVVQELTVQSEHVPTIMGAKAPRRRSNTTGKYGKNDQQNAGNTYL